MCVCVRVLPRLVKSHLCGNLSQVCLLTGSYDGGAGVSVLRAGGGALPVAFVLIGCHARVTFKGTALTDRTTEQT